MSSTSSLSSAIRVSRAASNRFNALRSPCLSTHLLPRRCYSQPRGDHEPTTAPSQDPGPSSSSSSKSQLGTSKNPFSPHWQRLSSSLASQRSTIEPKLRSELSRLGEKWNMYSGYDQIESAKSRVLDSEKRLDALRLAQNEAKARYVEAVTRRSTSQKTINDLLSRKASWSDEDLVKYTSLLRSEHAEAREEEMAREEFDSAERQVGKAWDEVVKRTLERYHDEQIWSDRVRNVSSYTQLAVVGLNVFIFALAILLVEPYKRRKLAETFETRLLKGEEQGRIALEEVIQRFDRSVQALSGELQELKIGQKGLLAAAGFQGKGFNKDFENSTSTSTSSTSSNSPDEKGILEEEEEALDLYSKAKRRTRFLHSPKSQDEKERREEIVVATSVAAVLGATLCTLLFRS